MRSSAGVRRASLVSLSIGAALAASLLFLTAPAHATATCSADGNGVVAASVTITDCKPFKCSAGVCATLCTDNSVCQSGFVCNASTRSCLAPGAPTGPLNSGCALGGATKGVGATELTAIALVAAAAVRRGRAKGDARGA